ncbi:MAG: hypothetical protein QOF48_2349 [Verrucomicrobiota bacterium]|jgi:putative nucleotidyltransferase with HDIG domain
MPEPKDRVEQYFDRIEHLPSAPTVVFELLELFKKQDCDIDRVVKLIARDPALTAELLKLTNSVMFGAEHRVDDIFEAVMRIGFYETYRMVMAVSGSKVMMKMGGAGAVPLRTLWKHSVTTAVAAEVIGGHLQESEATAFTAALLHDIGKIVLASLEGATFVRLLQEAGESEQSLVEAERAAFGADHAEIGSRLLERWNVTTDLVMAARFHHTPGLAAPYERLAAIVHLANVIAYSLPGEAASVPAEFRSGAASLEILRIPATSLSELTDLAGRALQKEKGLLEM